MGKRHSIECKFQVVKELLTWQEHGAGNQGIWKGLSHHVWSPVGPSWPGRLAPGRADGLQRPQAVVARHAARDPGASAIGVWHFTVVRAADRTDKKEIK
jgi:hypothetical protein